MRYFAGRVWRRTVTRFGAGVAMEETVARFEQDDLRHLLATAGSMSWGITDAGLVAREYKTGSVPTSL